MAHLSSRTPIAALGCRPAPENFTDNGITVLRKGTLLICFIPGGAVEMGLIALSLGINPLVVVLHHLLRILFIVGANMIRAGSTDWIS